MQRANIAIGHCSPRGSVAGGKCDARKERKKREERRKGQAGWLEGRKGGSRKKGRVGMIEKRMDGSKTRKRAFREERRLSGRRLFTRRADQRGSGWTVVAIAAVS